MLFNPTLATHAKHVAYESWIFLAYELSGSSPVYWGCRGDRYVTLVVCTRPWQLARTAHQPENTRGPETSVRYRTALLPQCNTVRAPRERLQRPYTMPHLDPVISNLRRRKAHA